MEGENEFLDQLTVFVLSCFVGYMVVWNVTPSLHTPLMSVTNAISGIIVIGGMLFISGSNPWIAGWPFSWPRSILPVAFWLPNGC